MRISLSDTDIFIRILKENANSGNNHYLRTLTTNWTKKTNIFLVCKAWHIHTLNIFINILRLIYFSNLTPEVPMPSHANLS